MRKLFIGLCLAAISLSAAEIYATFNVQPDKKANVAFNSSGIVNEVFVDIGSKIRENEVLATLHSQDIKALLQINETTLKYAKKDLERQKKVRNIIDKARYDSYAYKYESAKANVDYQKALLDKTILKAPFDAIVVSKEIESGDVVSGQMAKTAFVVQSIDKRKLILKFDQKYHKTVKVGDLFKYRIDGDTKQYRAKITKIYPTINEKERKMRAEVESLGIPVGLFGDGYIISK